MRYELFPSPLHYYNKRVQDDLEIEGEGAVFDVEEVVAHALDHFIYVFGITELHHAPGGESWFYFVEVFVVLVLFTDNINEMLSLGPWANQRHIAYEYVEELR